MKKIKIFFIIIIFTILGYYVGYFFSAAKISIFNLNESGTEAYVRLCDLDSDYMADIDIDNGMYSSSGEKCLNDKKVAVSIKKAIRVETDKNTVLFEMLGLALGIFIIIKLDKKETE